MVPDRNWGHGAVREFGFSDTETSPTKTQQVGCGECASEGVFTIPEVVFYYDGTSYCINHVPGVV